MTPEFAISLATFVVVFVLLNRLASAGPRGHEEDPDLERARRAIQAKIDKHADTLARRYLELCGQEPGGDPVSASFVREIEGFIGSVLLHDIELEHPGLGPAVREVVTLEREQVYALVLFRVQAT